MKIWTTCFRSVHEFLFKNARVYMRDYEFIPVSIKNLWENRVGQKDSWTESSELDRKLEAGLKRNVSKATCRRFRAGISQTRSQEFRILYFNNNNKFINKRKSKTYEKNISEVIVLRFEKRFYWKVESLSWTLAQIKTCINEEFS